jgi:hypothetical protein
MKPVIGVRYYLDVDKNASGVYQGINECSGDSFSNVTYEGEDSSPYTEIENKVSFTAMHDDYEEVIRG